MSVDETPGQELPPPPPHPEERHRVSLAEKIAAVLFCIFCFEVGLFLVVYPWLDTWGRNYWFWLRPDMHKPLRPWLATRVGGECGAYHLTRAETST